MMKSEATHRYKYSACLNTPIRKIDLVDVFVTDNCCAHQYDIALYNGSTPVNLSSAAKVYGYFIRHRIGEEDVTILLEGSLEGNVASVLLDGPCYAESGRFSLIVNIVENGVTSTVFYAGGSVLKGRTDKILDPGGIVPSLGDLLARIAEMEAATNAGKAAAADAQAAAQEARQTAADMQGQMDAHKADTAAALSAQKDTKADAIMDESARAASHSLHAQNGGMNVTLYGQTVETGSGDKSPENPYTIGGVGAADIHVGGKNLFDISKIKKDLITDDKTITTTARGYHYDLYSGTIGSGLVVPLDVLDRLPFVTSGQYVLTYDIETELNTKAVLIRMVNEDGTVSTPEVSGKQDGTGDIITINRPTRITVRRSTNEPATITNLMLTPGTDVIPYEPYNANTYALPLLPDGQPLFDGDTIENDVLVDGVRKCRVTKKWKRFEISGGFTYSSSDGRYARCAVNGLKNVERTRADGSNLICNQLMPWNGSVADTPVNTIQIIPTQSSQLYVNLNNLADLDAINAHFAKNPLVFVGLLTTPEIYVTDPIDIRKPSGIKPVVVAGSGETSVTYPHDTKHYTDQQHDSLAGAVERNAEAFNQLSEDKADKKDIPAPYTLPTASAEVKGGVKVGSGLQMDGDVLGVVQDNEYELIETIVFEVDTANVISRTAEPNRTPYNFRKIFVTADVPMASMAADKWPQIDTHKGKTIQASWQGFQTTNQAKLSYLECEVKEVGLLSIRSNVSPLSPSNNYTAINGHVFDLIADSADTIRRFYLWVTEASPIPAGSTIKIYGVRA